MPRFSENEKMIIKEKLNTEGERLFTTHGLKKVSVDELVKVAGISKGSFYAFYENKEHLYMAILINIQQRIWNEMDNLYEENKDLPSHKLVKKVFLCAFSSVDRYPMLKQTDNEVNEYLYRKLPKEIIEAHAREDRQELEKLRAYGIRFSCDLEVVTETLQILSIALLNLHSENESTREAVMNILLDGVINEIVSDEK